MPARPHQAKRRFQRPPSAKRDANHNAIVDAFKDGGASVVDLAAVGSGVPDLLVGYRGVDFLCEVKDPENAAENRNRRDRLSRGQLDWCLEWRGRTVVVACSPTDAYAILREIEDEVGTSHDDASMA